MATPKTLQDAIIFFSDYQNCHRVMVDIRWPDGVVRCPHCGFRLIDKQRAPVRLGKPGQAGQAGTGLWKRRSRCEWVLTNSRGSDDSRADQAHPDHEL